MNIIYYTESIQIEINKGKRHMRQCPEETRPSFHCPFPVESQGLLNTFSNNVCQHLQRVTNQGSSTMWAWVFRVFFFFLRWVGGSQACKHATSVWLTSATQTLLSHPSHTTEKAFTANHVANINYLTKMVLCGPRPPAYKKYSYMAEYSMGSESSPRSPPKTSPEARPFLNNPGLLS